MKYNFENHSMALEVRSKKRKMRRQSAGKCAYIFLAGVFSLLFMYSPCVYADDFSLILEAESAELTGALKVKDQAGFSGNKYVGDNHAGSRILFKDVRVEKEGAYEFRTYYTCTESRMIAVKSGYYPSEICLVETRTPDWDKPPTAMMKCYLYLNAGSNQIEITPYGGDGPNIDKFELSSLDFEMPRPDPEKTAWSYDLTDDAVSITVSGEPIDVSAIDNDEETVWNYSGGSAIVRIDCDQPYLLTGYYLSAGFDSKADEKKWKFEYSADGTSWKTFSPSSTKECAGGVLFSLDRNARDVDYVAAHYRLTSSGGSLAEVQLFGVPFHTNSDGRNFPADLTEGLDLRTYVLGVPFGMYEFGSIDERCYNLFDRNMTKKYHADSERTFEVDVELSDLTRLDSYTLTSCQDLPERDPKSWVVEGFDRDWEIVDEVSNFTFPVRYATMKFNVGTDKPYKGFRLRTTQNNGAEDFQLLKWQLFGETQPSFLSESELDGASFYVSGNELIIRLPERALYRVCDLSGREVAGGRLEAGECRCMLPVGMYVVGVWADSGCKVEKVIVK